MGGRLGLRRGAFIVSVILAASGLTGCDLVSLIETLAEHDCRTDASARVGTDRMAILFLTSHVYMPPGTSDTEAYVRFRHEVVPPTLDRVNDYLEAVGLNVVLSLETSDLIEDSDLAHVSLDAGGNPQGASRQALIDAATADRSNLHVHWSQSSNQPDVAGFGGGHFEPFKEGIMWIGMIEDPLDEPNSLQQRSRTFAHELGHVFSLRHEGQVQANLMYEVGSGNDLTSTQIQMFWNDFNASHDSFVVISCLRDPALRSTIERHTAEELRDAVSE